MPFTAKGAGSIERKKDLPELREILFPFLREEFRVPAGKFLSFRGPSLQAGLVMQRGCHNAYIYNLLKYC
jgi:hypothetical protein